MQGIEWEGPEEAFRRGYEHAAIETFHKPARAARSLPERWPAGRTAAGGPCDFFRENNTAW
jgi:hypothetical protein